ncbi:amino acid ABC transporter permease [Mesorhizobium sp. IMUNJ 23033]|uniref:amino acid ABC transporter permease n=1 Tax=Mesorhizobium sp. IMUNJ 23033 TaxID=3378039 RepID=UPI00384C6F63
MNFDTNLIIRSLPEILGAFGVTLLMWVAGVIGSAVLGFLVAVGRRYGRRWLGYPLWLYVETIRGTPFLIQLFLLYYGGPFVGLSLEPIPAGLFGLTIYGAAYFSEIFRGGFEAVPLGHVEAAECVGLNRNQIIRRIFIPEMTMLVLPASVNMAIILLKETAVLSIITVPELTLVISAIGSQQYAFVESLFLLALFYWGLVELSGMLGRFLETRLSKYRFATA